MLACDSTGFQVNYPTDVEAYYITNNFDDEASGILSYKYGSL